MTAFALVHGAWHGAWCWERLVPELEARGHRVVAVDLPFDDPTATFETYADAVIYALDAEEEVVVVGHSLAGPTFPLVAARRPVRRLVCDDDRMVNPDRARRVARERLDADLVEPPGGDSPFLCRPRELAAVLDQAAERA